MTHDSANRPPDAGAAWDELSPPKDTLTQVERILREHRPVLIVGTHYLYCACDEDFKPEFYAHVAQALLAAGLTIPPGERS